MTLREELQLLKMHELLLHGTLVAQQGEFPLLNELSHCTLSMPWQCPYEHSSVNFALPLACFSLFVTDNYTPLRT